MIPTISGLPPMPTWVTDIETFGDWEKVPEHLRERIVNRAISMGDKRHPSETCSLHWPRAEVITIGMRLVEDEHFREARTIVFQQRPGNNYSLEAREFNDEQIVFVPNEKTLLACFWQAIEELAPTLPVVGDESKAVPLRAPSLLVTWNGEHFDIPFLTNRSRIHGMKRQPFSHLDLARDLCGGQFASRPPYGFEEMCEAFGIPSSKTGGMDGASVAQAWREARYDDIAQYSAREVFSLSKLFERVHLYPDSRIRDRDSRTRH